MASASSKRSLDTDYITFRKVFAKLSDNSQIPANYVLTSVGDGKTYWASPSTLGGLPTFSEFAFDSNTYAASPDLRILRINAGNGIGLSTSLSSSPSTLQLYGKNFGSVDVSGVDSLFAYSNFRLTNSFLIAPSGFISTSSTPGENTITIQSLVEAPALSTNIISYQSLKVISSLTTPSDTTPYLGNMLFSKQDASAYPVFTGYQDFIFQTNSIPPIIGLELSSYSAKTLLGISTVVATSFLSTLSSVSSLYTQKNIFSTAMISLSTTEYRNFSTNVSTTFGVSNYTQLTYNQKTGDTLARATIIQLVDNFGILNAGVSTISSFKTPLYIMLSTNKGFIDSYSTPTALSTSTFTDFTAGSIFNFTINGIFTVSTQLSTVSTTLGSGIRGFQDGFQQTLAFYTVSTASTIANLGTLGYVSSLSLQSSVQNLGTTGFVSTLTLVSSFSTFVTGYPSTVLPFFQSTTKGLNENQQSISTLTLQSSLTSSVRGLVLELATTYVSSSRLFTTIQSTTTGIFGYAGSSNYLSTFSLGSTLQSTVSGLSNRLYITSTQLVSSIYSTNTNIGFVTTNDLVKQVNELSNFVSTQSLESTTRFFTTYTKHFTSSLVLPAYTTTINSTFLFNGRPYFSNPQTVGRNYYFKSVEFESLSGFDSLLQNAKYVTLEYTPTILISPWDSNNFYNFKYSPAISTGIEVGGTFIPNSVYVTRFSAPNPVESNVLPPISSNVFSKKIVMQLDRQNFLNAATNGLSIVHVFENLTDFYLTYLAYTVDVSIFTPRSNALFISIYN